MMVKLFNITLDKGDKESLITLDVQEKVIDDIMDGIESVLGKRKNVGCIQSPVRKIDDLLKSWLILADSKEQLTRKFEKIILEEHFTNLYAPRILVEETEEADGVVKVVAMNLLILIICCFKLFLGAKNRGFSRC